jgi:hypothetical protein
VRQQVVFLWRANVPIKKIAEVTGCGTTAINRFVRQAGLPPQHGGGRRAQRIDAVWSWSDVASELDAAPVQHDLL